MADDTEIREAIRDTLVDRGFLKLGRPVPDHISIEAAVALVAAAHEEVADVMKENRSLTSLLMSNRGYQETATGQDH